MRAILQVGAARFIIEGHSFESFCEEIVNTLSPLVSFDPHTICLRCSLDAFVAQAVSEEELVVAAERERSGPHSQAPRPSGVTGAGHDWRHSPAAHRVLSGRRFSGVPAGVTPNPLAELQNKSVRVGPAVLAAAHPVYIYSQDTFESAEAVVHGVTDEARARESRMLALGLLTAPRETPTACALPTVVLDTFMSTSAPVAPYYDATGQPCRRRSLPTTHEEEVAAAVAAVVTTRSPHHPPQQEVVALPHAVKEQLEQQSYAPLLRELVKPGSGFAPPSAPAPVPAGPNPVHLLSVHTLPSPSAVAADHSAAERRAREEVRLHEAASHVRGDGVPPPLPPPPHAHAPGDAGLVHSPPASADRTAPHPQPHPYDPSRGPAKPPAGLGMPPFVPRPQQAPPQAHAPAPTRAAEQRPAPANARCMTFQRGIRVDVAELITGKSSRPASATVSAVATPQPTASTSPDARVGSAPVVRSAVGAYPFQLPTPPASERRRSFGNASAASSSMPTGMRTPLPGMSAEERDVVDRLLRVDDMTPVRMRTPVMLRSMPITGTATNVDVTASALLPVAQSERRPSDYVRGLSANPAEPDDRHPYNSNRLSRPRLQSAPSGMTAGRTPYGTSSSGGGGAAPYGALPRIGSAPRGGLEHSHDGASGDAARRASSNARATYNQLFSLTPVSDKYAQMLREE